MSFVPNDELLRLDKVYKRQGLERLRSTEMRWELGACRGVVHISQLISCLFGEDPGDRDVAAWPVELRKY